MGGLGKKSDLRVSARFGNEITAEDAEEFEAWILGWISGCLIFGRGGLDFVFCWACEVWSLVFEIWD